MRNMQCRVMAVFLLVTIAMMLATADKAFGHSPVWTNIRTEERGFWNRSTDPSLRRLELRLREMHREGLEEYHFLPFETPETPLPENWC